MNPFGLVFVAAGIFSISGTVCDWDWFINSRKAQFFVVMFGRNGPRIFCGILGTAIVILGTLLVFGVIENAR